MKNTKRTMTRSNQVSGWVTGKANLGGLVAGVLLAIGFLHSWLPVQAAIAGSGTIGLAWDSSASPGVAGYRVYIGTTSGNYTTKVEAGNARTTTIQNLASGVTYYFAVKAFNTSGVESAFSNEITFVPGAATLQLTISATGQAVLTVNGVAGRTYEIQATRDLKTWSVLGNVTVGAGGSAAYTDNPPLSGLRRFYRTRDLLP